MLRLNVDEARLWDGENDRFVIVPSFSLSLEHSLLALSKWESIWETPFLERLGSKTNPMSLDMMISYIQCMAIKPISDLQINSLTQDHYDLINTYLNKKHTATTITETKKTGVAKQIWTSELFYYNIFANQIPIEVEKWNLNRLLMLFSIFRIENEKQDPKNKKRTAAEINKYYDDREALNAKRKAAMNTKG